MARTNPTNGLTGLALLAIGLCAASGIGCANSDLTAPSAGGLQADDSPASQVDLPVEGDGSGSGDAPRDPEPEGRGGKAGDPPSAPQPTEDTSPE